MRDFIHFGVLRLWLVWLPILAGGCPTVSDPVPIGGLAAPVSGRVVDSADRSAENAESAENADDADDLRALLGLVERTLEENRENRQLSIEQNAAWQIMHGVLAYGTEFEIETPEGRVPAIEYILQGGRVPGFEPIPGDMFGDPPRRGLRMELQPGMKIGQGHHDQWLAIFVQSGLGIETVVRSGDHEFVFEDWVRQIEHDIPLNLELEFSWTLTSLLAYRPTDHRWTARDGNDYNIEALLESEIGQSLPASACGGTHRLIGIAMALERRRNENGPIVGVWADGERLVADSIAQAKRNQNPDGSFSTAYHHRTGWTRDLGEVLSTTGHVLEFLAIAASDETLREAWVRRSVRQVCDVLEQCREIDLECGGLYHALHGLQVYRQRLSDLEAAG